MSDKPRGHARFLGAKDIKVLAKDACRIGMDNLLFDFRGALINSLELSQWERWILQLYSSIGIAEVDRTLEVRTRGILYASVVWRKVSPATVKLFSSSSLAHATRAGMA